MNLLRVDRRHSANPGDDREMVHARTDFLAGGYYEPLRGALCALCAELLPRGGLLLDSGCGEGYYTAGIAAALHAADPAARVAGIDISKEAVKLAARRARDAQFAVASAFSLPLADGAADLLLNCFSPLCPEEFLRVLRPGGAFLYVVPSARHLWQLKCAVYDAPYENSEKIVAYPGFTWLRAAQVRGSITLPDAAAIEALFGMTPYFWKTPRAGRARLAALQTLKTDIGFDIHVYRKNDPSREVEP